MIKIKHKITGKVLHTVDGDTFSGADLRGADLYRADLRDADLSGADLYRADLRDADLSRANLSGADLSRANLSGADLSRADLSGANLSRANLVGATIVKDYKLKTTPIQILNLDYGLLITDDHILIGCQTHTIEQWELFTDVHIKAMDGQSALDFWHVYKPAIMAMAMTKKNSIK